MRHLITEPQHLLADLSTRPDERRPYDLLAFSALPDAPVRPVVERRAGLLRRLRAVVRAPLGIPAPRQRAHPAIAADTVACS